MTGERVVQMNLEEIYKPVEQELAASGRLLKEMSRSESETISDAVLEILNAGGKRMRSALVLMAAKACCCCEDTDRTGIDRSSAGPPVTSPRGTALERAVQLATAIELIHTASLIHDDVIDKADCRRGVSTVNARWGNRLAVLAGDHVYSKAIGILAEAGDSRVMRNVSSTVVIMSESEMAQTVSRRDVTVSEKEYLSMIAGKTASLLSCSCRVGAMLGNVHDGEVEALGAYGLNLGMAFQITDDLLDVAGDRKTLGKPLGNDIREGRLTLPFIKAMHSACAGEREWICRLFKSNDEVNEGDLARIQSLVAKHGGIEYSLEMAERYADASKSALKSIGASASRTSLEMLADYVVDRARRQ